MGGMGGLAAKMMGGGQGTFAYPDARHPMMTGKFFDIAMLNTLAPGKEAEQQVPAGLGLGASLPLLPPTASVGREAGGTTGVPDGEIHIKYYWGCGSEVRAGQPRELHMRARGGKFEMSGDPMQGRYAPDRGVDPNPSYVLWPNPKTRNRAPASASLVGQHRITGQGVPESLEFELQQAADLLIAVEHGGGDAAAHQPVGAGEQARIGIVAGTVPQQAGHVAQAFAQAGGHRSRRAPRDRGEQAATFGAYPLAQPRQQHLQRRGGPGRMPGGSAHEQHDAWPRQRQQRGETRARVGQPGVVDRIEATEHRDHVGAAQAVVAGRDHQVPVPRIDAWIQHLHGARATRAHQPRGQRALAAATDGQRGDRSGQRCGECRAEGASGPRQAPWRQPAPGCGGVQPRRHWRGDAQRTGQRRGLADVAGTSVGQQPGRGIQCVLLRKRHQFVPELVHKIMDATLYTGRLPGGRAGDAPPAFRPAIPRTKSCRTR